MPTAGVRVAIASLFLLPLLLWRGLGPQLARHWKKVFFIGLLNSAILNATAPLFGALVAWVWLKDRPHGLRILGLLIGFVGVALLAWDKASFKPSASGLATGSQLGATPGLALPTL